jgi:death-on-curing protein
VRYLSVAEVVELHLRILHQSGGSEGIRDPSALLSAVGQPLQTFDGIDLYPTIVEKASALAFFLCRNHAFIDGNKRVGHAALEVMLVLNGLELSASIDEQEAIMLRLADGTIDREDFTAWVRGHAIPK